MSFHHFNLRQNDNLFRARSNEEEGGRQQRPPTTFVAFPMSATGTGVIGALSNLAAAGTPAAAKLAEEENEDNNYTLSDVESHYSSKSWWADLSEVESMAPSRKSGMEEDDDDSDSDAEQKKNNADTFMPLGGDNCSLPSRRSNRSRTTSTRGGGGDFDLQSCGDSTVEEGSIASVYDRSSLGGGGSSSHVSATNLKKMSPRQRYRFLLKEAELQASQAQQDIEVLQRQLENIKQQQQQGSPEELQREIVQYQAKEHELRMELKQSESEYTMVRGRLVDAVQENQTLTASLQQQEAVMSFQTRDHAAEKERLTEQIRAAELAKASAEAKLEEALEKIDALQKQLDEQQKVAKSVRFGDDASNQVIEFRSSDYTSRLATALEEKEELSSQLKSLQLEMEGLEDAHASLRSLHQESGVERRQELSVEKQAATEARSQVRDLLSSLVEMQQNAERIEQERLGLELQLEEAHKASELASVKLLKKEHFLKRVQREVGKMNAAIASMQQHGDSTTTPSKASAAAAALVEGKADDLFYELEKARFRLEKRASTIQEERQSLQEKATAATNKFHQISDQLVVIELEKNELMQQLEDLKRTVSALKEENNRIKGEKAQLEKALLDQQSFTSTVEVKVHELELERATLQEEVLSLRAGLTGASDGTVLRSVSQNGDDEARLQELEKSLVETELDLQKARKQLRERFEETKHLETQLREMEHELDDARKENSFLKETHEKELQKQVETSERAQTQANEARLQVEEMKKYRGDAQEQLQELSAARTSLQKQLQEKTDELWFVQQEKEHLQNRVTALDASLNEARHDALCSVSTNVFVLQRNALKVQLQQKETQLSDLKHHVETTGREAGMKDERIRELVAVEAALEEQIHSLCQDLENALAKVEQANAKIARLEAEKRDLQASLSAAKSFADETEKKNAQLLAEAKRMDAEYNNKILDLRIDHTRVLLQVSHLERERDDMSRTIETFDKEKASLTAKLDETTELWNEAQQQFQLKKKELKEVRRTSEEDKKESKALRAQLELSTNERATMGRKLEESTRETEELNLELALLGQRNAALEEEKVKLVSNVADLQSQLARLSAEKEALVSEQRQAMEDQSSLLSAANTAFQDAERERSSLQSKVKSLLQAQARLEDRLAEPEGLWKEATEQCRKKERRIPELEEDLRTSNENKAASDETSTALSQINEEKAAVLKQADTFRQERDRAVLAEVGLRKVTVDLQGKLDDQTKKVKKLAKILKRTIEKQAAASKPVGTMVMLTDENDDETMEDRRVSRMPIILKLRHQNKISGSTEKTEVSAEYTGPLIGGKPNGPGMLRFESGDLYLGEFRDGEMNGTGSYVRRRPAREGDNICLSGMFANNEFVLPLSPSNSSDGTSN